MSATGASPRSIRACQELPGQELFQYVDEGARPRDVTSSDVNAYLREISGDDITAKDFRTWHGTVLAAMALQEFEKFDSQAGAKSNIRDAIQRVAARLGNTPTICRKCYVHPEIITTYIEGSLLLEVKDKVEAELRDDLAELEARRSRRADAAANAAQPHAQGQAQGEHRRSCVVPQAAQHFAFHPDAAHLALLTVQKFCTALAGARGIIRSVCIKEYLSRWLLIAHDHANGKAVRTDDILTVTVRPAEA